MSQISSDSLALFLIATFLQEIFSLFPLGEEVQILNSSHFKQHNSLTFLQRKGNLPHKVQTKTASKYILLCTYDLLLPGAGKLMPVTFLVGYTNDIVRNRIWTALVTVILSWQSLSYQKWSRRPFVAAKNGPRPLLVSKYGPILPILVLYSPGLGLGLFLAGH